MSINILHLLKGIIDASLMFVSDPNSILHTYSVPNFLFVAINIVQFVLLIAIVFGN